jgi:TetR/AcrR family transcriptional regulator, cholesterol catabolism regulator
MQKQGIPHFCSIVNPAFNGSEINVKSYNLAKYSKLQNQFSFLVLWPESFIVDTKERILSRTFELFRMMGMKSLTMDFIAMDLGISKRTIYELFRDKDELLMQTIEYWIKANNIRLMQIIDQTDNVVEAIFVIIDQQHKQITSQNLIIFEDLKKFFVRLKASYYANREKCREFSVSYALLERGKREGIFREELKIDVVDTFIFELVNLFHNSEGIRLMQLNRKEALENIFLPYFRGICTNEGQKLIDSYLHKLEF